MFFAFFSAFALSDLVLDGKQPTVKREQMRYDGRTFEQWRHDLRTELKHKRRVESLHAIRMFATHGYASEAALAALALVELRKDEVQNLANAYEERQELEKAIYDVLEAAIKKNKSVLSPVLCGQSTVQKEFTLGYLRQNAVDPAMLPVIAKLARSEDATSSTALNVLTAQVESPGVLDELGSILDKGNLKSRLAIATYLYPRTDEAVILLLNALTDRAWRVRAAAAYSLGVEPKEKHVEQIQDRLAELLDDPSDSVRVNSLKTLHALGARPKKSTAILLAIAQKSKLDNRVAAVEMLGQFAPKDTEVLRVLGKMWMDDLPENLRKAVDTIIPGGWAETKPAAGLGIPEKK